MKRIVSGAEAVALLTKLPKAKGRQRYTPGVMNKTEQAFAAALELRKHRGEVAWFDFESWTFKLAKDLRYTPDFPVMDSDGLITCYDVKGRTVKDGVSGPYIKDGSLEKIKMAAKLNPMFRWVITWPLVGGMAWGVREVEGV